MEIIQTNSYVKQPSKIIGPTVTLVYTNEQTSTEKDEQGEKYTLYSYTLYRFVAGEYELVQVGSLPADAVWDDVLRGIERSGMYDHADVMISKYSTDAADETMKQKWIDFKAAVRATQKQKTYPQTVKYPAMPE